MVPVGDATWVAVESVGVQINNSNCSECALITHLSLSLPTGAGVLLFVDWAYIIFTLTIASRHARSHTWRAMAMSMSRCDEHTGMSLCHSGWNNNIHRSAYQVNKTIKGRWPDPVPASTSIWANKPALSVASFFWLPVSATRSLACSRTNQTNRFEVSQVIYTCYCRGVPSSI